MNDIYWNFATEKYHDQEQFSKELIIYNEEESANESLNIELIFNSAKKISVQFMYWGEDEDGDEDQIEESFEISTENALGFSAKEFLYQVHNVVCEKLTDDDTTFFEGLIPASNTSGTPFFFLRQGS